MKTDFLSLKTKDAIKGAILTVLAAVLNLIYQSITNKTGIDWSEVAGLAISTLIAYLIKNFFTDSIKQANLTLDKEGITRVMSAEEIKAKEQLK